MQRTCEYCGAQFDGSPQARFCSEAHRKAAARSRTDGAQKSDTREVGQEKSDKAPETVVRDSLGKLPADVDRGWGVCVRWQDPDTRRLPVYEPNGPSGLSLIAYPHQVEGDLRPSAEQLKKLGETTGAR